MDNVPQIQPEITDDINSQTQDEIEQSNNSVSLENMNDEAVGNDPDFDPELENSSNSYSEDEAFEKTENYVEDEGPRRKRSTKYEMNTNKWQENINRVNREKGKQYVGKRKENGKWRYDILKEPKTIKQACYCKLSASKKSALKCRMLHQMERENIFIEFWQYTWAEKKLFVRNHVTVHPTIRKRGSKDVSRRSYTNQFHLGKERLRVCKTMFLNTIGTQEWVIKKWAKIDVLKTIDRNINSSTNSNEIPNTKLSTLHAFFESLPKLESHYCRASTSKLYLEPVWDSKAHLFKFYKNDYCKTHNEVPVSIATFHKEFDKKRLSLYKPKKDLCDTCVAFETNNLPEERYYHHIELKDEARNEKTKDKESATEVFTMDLQSVLLCPKSNVSSLYYKTKLIVHNFTLYDLKRNQGYCYLWNESEGGLTSNEFTTIIDHFLREHLQQYYTEDQHIGIEIILWSDGCGYQNRNATLSNGLFNFALDTGVTIMQKYLQKGHTQMEVDSIHSVIERKIRNKKINIPADYVYVCKTACQKSPYKVKYLDHTFFKKYDGLNYFKSIRPGRGTGAPMVNDVKAFKYSREGVFFKLRHSVAEWQALPIRLNLSTIQATENHNLSQLHKNRLKIKAEKYGHLQQLKLSMESDYHDFYDNLPHD